MLYAWLIKQVDNLILYACIQGQGETIIHMTNIQRQKHFIESYTEKFFMDVHVSPLRFEYQDIMIFCVMQ